MNDLLQKISDYIYKNGLEKNYYSVVVISDSDTTEQFHMEKIDLRPSNACHDSYSVSKSITAMAAGILVDRQLLSPEDKLSKWLQEYLIDGTDKQWGDLTVDDVMRHRTGASTGVDFDIDNAETWEDTEWLHTLFSHPITGTPGKDFVYSDGNFYIISRIVEKITGMDLDAFLQKEIFTTLGFHQNAWSRDVASHTLGGTGLYMRTEDMAKLGRLCLDEGNWNGKQIFSSDWAKRMRGAISNNLPNYGYGIPYLENGGYASCGMYGQGYYFNPKTRTVCAWHTFDTAGLQDFLIENDR